MEKIEISFEDFEALRRELEAAAQILDIPPMSCPIRAVEDMAAFTNEVHHAL